MSPPSPDLILGVDVGNSKTHVAVTDLDGAVRYTGVSAGASPQQIGVARSLGVVLDCLRSAGAPTTGYASCALALAGVDFPDEEAAYLAAAEKAQLATVTSVYNDTYALLRAGTSGPDGIAVVAGAGINCVGVYRGVPVRFHSLGAISGDWGGGYDLGEGALGLACRSQDGRGAPTVLQDSIPQYFGLRTPAQVVEAIHRDHIPRRRLPELAPLVLRAATQSDPVATVLTQRLAEEIGQFASAAAQRLHCRLSEIPLLVGGGLLQAGTDCLTAQVAHVLHTIDPDCRPRIATSPPIAGAVLLALDQLPQAAAVSHYPESGQHLASTLTGMLTRQRDENS